MTGRSHRNSGGDGGSREREREREKKEAERGSRRRISPAGSGVRFGDEGEERERKEIRAV